MSRTISIAAVAIPDGRRNPPDPRHMIIVTVIADEKGRIWHLYPDGDRILVLAPETTVSKPRTETAVKPRVKPKSRKRQ